MKHKLIIICLVAALLVLGGMPAFALDLKYDGWFRYGYNFGDDPETNFPSHNFYWTRVHIYGALTDNLSFMTRFQGIEKQFEKCAENDPFIIGDMDYDFEGTWYYLSWKTALGQFDFGRYGKMPSINEELINEINGIYGSTVIFTPSKLPNGFAGSLAVAYKESSPGIDRWYYQGQMDYQKNQWKAGVNYFYSPLAKEMFNASAIWSVELQYQLTPAWSFCAELGEDIGYDRTLKTNDPDTGAPLMDVPSFTQDDLALIGVRYMDPKWMAFAGCNIPREHYAIDVTHFFHPNLAVRAEYNNSFANYSPGFQLSLYFMFVSPKSCPSTPKRCVPENEAVVEPEPSLVPQSA